MNDERRAGEWNAPTLSGVDASHDARLWRKQFLKNPLLLGPPGIVTALCWLCAAVTYLYMSYLGVQARARDDLPTSSNPVSIYISAAIFFGISWVFLLALSPFLARWTTRWARERNKDLKNVFRG